MTPAKIQTFAFDDDADTWESVDDAFRRLVVPVYRKPQAGWAVQASFPTQWLWFVPEVSGSANTDPDVAVFPEWLRGYWDAQAGRWVSIGPLQMSSMGKIATGGMTAASGDTLGSGTVDFYQRVTATLTIRTGVSRTVYNWSDEAGTAGTKVNIVFDGVDWNIAGFNGCGD